MTVATKKWTYREFQEMEFEETDSYLYELINGVIVRRASPKVIHQRVLRKLLVKFEIHIAENGIGEIFPAPMDVVLDDTNAPQPDLVYISTGNKNVVVEDEDVIIGVPDLVVEIISPSSIKRDRIEKKALYEQFGIAEYWLVDPNNQSIEVYILQDGKYELFVFADATEKAQSKVIAGLEIDAPILF